MLRALAFFALILLWPAGFTPAQAQADKVCGGHFERFLKGYTILPPELNHFLADTVALDACHSELDPSNVDHQMIKAYIAENRREQDLVTASSLFATACLGGRKVACYYSIMYKPGGVEFETPADTIERAMPLLETDLPVAKAFVGVVMLLGADGIPRNLKLGRRLINQASDNGDYWASFYLAEQARRERDEREFAKWLNLAADQGHVLAMTYLGSDAALSKENAEAIKWYKRAASSDLRFFRTAISDARYWLGLKYANEYGGLHNPTEARRWLEAAAELGHDKAKQHLDWMERKQKQRKPITREAIDAVFAQTPRIAKFDHRPVEIHLQHYDGVSETTWQNATTELLRAKEAIERAITGLSLRLTNNGDSHSISVILAPAEAIRKRDDAIRSMLGRPPNKKSAAELCFATRTSPRGDFKNIYGIGSAVIYLPGDLGNEAIVACVARALPSALGFTPPKTSTTIDSATLDALAVIYDRRVTAGMTRAQVLAMFDLQ